MLCMSCLWNCHVCRFSYLPYLSNAHLTEFQLKIDTAMKFIEWCEPFRTKGNIWRMCLGRMLLVKELLFQTAFLGRREEFWVDKILAIWPKIEERVKDVLISVFWRIVSWERPSSRNKIFVQAFPLLLTFILLSNGYSLRPLQFTSLCTGVSPVSSYHSMMILSSTAGDPASASFGPFKIGSKNGTFTGASTGTHASSQASAVMMKCNMSPIHILCGFSGLWHVARRSIIKWCVVPSYDCCKNGHPRNAS